MEGVPVIIRDWPANVVVAVIHKFVIEGVKLINSVVILQRECVASLIAVWKLCVEAIRVVKRLDKVTDVMDKKTESVRFSNVLIIVKLVHQESVHIACFVVITLFTRKESNDISQTFDQVPLTRFDVIVRFLAFLDPRCGQEMEVALPSLAMVLEIIGESRALDKWVLVLIGTELRVIVAQVGEVAEG